MRNEEIEADAISNNSTINKTTNEEEEQNIPQNDVLSYVRRTKMWSKSTNSCRYLDNGCKRVKEKYCNSDRKGGGILFCKWKGNVYIYLCNNGIDKSVGT